MPSHWRVRLLVIAIATALCSAGIRVGPGGWEGSSGSGRKAVELSAPAAHAQAPARVTRAKDGAGIVPGTLPGARQAWLGLSERPRPAVSPDPPHAYRDALRALPLAPRPPPLA